MAASKFFQYKTALRNIIEGNINLDTDTLKAVLLHDGYTPGTQSHSVLAQIVNFQATASSTIVNAITLTSVNVTGTGNNTVKVDAADISGFSAGGDSFQAKYLAVYAESASRAGSDNLLVGFLDLNTGASTGVEGTQVNVTWPTGGLMKFNGNA